MADIDMKQKIKEVRDKFLSNNQIEDIRQNITLGVEERLKFLNTEQIKVVELLEAKHRELDNELRGHAEKLNVDRKTIESSLDETALNLKAMVNEQSVKLEDQNSNYINEMSELESRLKKEFKMALDVQENLLKSNASSLSEDMKKIETSINENEIKTSKNLSKSAAHLENLSEKNSAEMHLLRETLEKKFEEIQEKTLNSVDEKLSIYDSDKKIFLEDATQAFSNALLKIETKIETFIANHEMVEDIIDNRLKEFRNAQKAAFEELEAALTLLERHQDDTINRFKNKSELGLNKHINLQTSSPKNRGSILHQPKEPKEDLIAAIPAKDPENNDTHKKNLSYGRIKPAFLFILAFLLVSATVVYFNFDYEDLFKLAINFSE